MPTYSFKKVQKIPVDLTTAWNFFSDPTNLAAITPSAMAFRILSTHHGSVMYPGQIIEYKVKPVLGIPVYWMTEITHVKDKEFFVDEQRVGPYKMWHHQHQFREIEGGVEMTDIVHYRNPFGFLGVIANSLFVKRQLSNIFKYRFQQIEKLFGSWPDGAESVQSDL